MAEFRHQQLSRILINGLSQCNRHAHLEKRLHKVAALFRHTNGKLLHRDRFRNDDIAGLFGLGFALTTAEVESLFLFPRAFQSRQRTGTGTVIAIKRAGNRQLARLTTIVARPITARLVRCLFGFLTLALNRRSWTCWNLNRRKATRRRRRRLNAILGGRRRFCDFYLLRRWRGCGFGLAIFLGTAALFLSGTGALFLLTPICLLGQLKARFFSLTLHPRHALLGCLA
jgi:hypothetical protein